MAKILTPLTLLNSFDLSAPTDAFDFETREEDGIKIEEFYFYGRDTGAGRVKIAATFACASATPASETVLVLPDSPETIDEDILKMFVRNGFSAMGVDYRGEWKDCSRHTVYPEVIDYANTAKCGRHKDYVDDSAEKTSWYEWVSVGLYARKYILERTGAENIAVAGIRDGGEIAWKLGVFGDFSCIIPVCAAGWKAYVGSSKYLSEEPALNEERYRFIAGVDSQAYAPYVKCPVLMLCSTNDPKFDYDRAYDTFSRINENFVEESVIAYSVLCDASIGVTGTADMFLFLNKNLKNHQVFMPQPATVVVEVDEEDNLIAGAEFDDLGIVENCGLFLAEDCTDSSLREWMQCPLKRKISSTRQEFYLNIYEKTTTIFVLCFVTYSNGFTVWSKIAVKKISGTFRNMQSRCKVLYSVQNGADGFTNASPKEFAVGGTFFEEEGTLPRVVEKSKGVSGIFCRGGLSTYRMNNPRFAPSAGNALSLDLYCDETADVTLSLYDLSTGEEYIYVTKIIGGVWQNLMCESKAFKTVGGVSLTEFMSSMKFTVACPADYAVNNVMWL